MFILALLCSLIVGSIVIIGFKSYTSIAYSLLLSSLLLLLLIIAREENWFRMVLLLRTTTERFVQLI